MGYFLFRLLIMDREGECPMLVRDFFKGEDNFPPEEVQLYTWPDATLRELASLLKQERPTDRALSRRMAHFTFSAISVGRTKWQQKHLGTVQSLEKAMPEEKTL